MPISPEGFVFLCVMVLYEALCVMVSSLLSSSLTSTDNKKPHQPPNHMRMHISKKMKKKKKLEYPRRTKDKVDLEQWPHWSSWLINHLAIRILYPSYNLTS